MGLLFNMKEQFIKEWEDFKPTNNKDNPLEIIIKPEILDTSNIQEGEGNKGLWRPTNFSEYIGQEEAKNRINNYIVGCKKFGEKFPNTFLLSPPGCGKTTLALILANMLNEKFVICTAGEIKSEQQIVDKIVEANGGIIFLDEAHRISVKIGTFLLPILEDYQIQGKKIKQFTMIFSTTHIGNISKNLEALIQRFPLQVELQHYNVVDLIKILQQFKNKKYPSIIISDDIYNKIAENSKFTPRIALSLLKEYIFIENFDIVLKNNNIVKDGIKFQDIQILQYLLNNSGAGKNSIAKYLRVEPNTYEFSIEPYLIFKEFINVSSKRKISDKGKEFLNQIKGV
jgi:Holliday junction DNA helicase RuvB